MRRTILLARGEEAERGAAVADGVAEALPLGGDDIRAIRRRRASTPSEAGSVMATTKSALVRGRSARWRDVLQRAKEVGLLDDDGLGLGVECGFERGERGDAVLQLDLADGEAARLGVGLQCRAILRIERARDDDFAAPHWPDRQQRRLTTAVAPS